VKRLLKLLFLWIPGVLLLYAVTGFWAVPALVEKYAPQIIRQTLGVGASLGKMRFNPFTMTLTIDGFTLKDDRGGDLFTLQRMAVDVDPVESLFRRAVTFDEIGFRHPTLRIVVDENGRLNFAEMLARLDAKGDAAESEAADAPRHGPLPPLLVKRFDIRDFVLDYEDRSRSRSVKIVTSPTSFELRDFSTRPEAQSRLAFEIRPKKGGLVRIAADFSLQPLEAKGRATIERFDITTLNQFLRSVSPLRLTDGNVDFGLDFDILRKGSDFLVTLHNGTFSLEDIRLSDGKEAPVRLGDFRIEGVDADFQKRLVTAETVRLADSRIDVTYDGSRFSFQRWIDVKGKKTPAAPATRKKAGDETAAQKGWMLKVQKISMRDTSTRFEGPAYRFDASYRAEISRLSASTQEGLTARIDLLQTGDIDLYDKRGSSHPYSLRRLALEKGSLDTRKGSLKIGRVHILKPSVRLVIFKDGTTNLDRLFATPSRHGTARAATPDRPKSGGENTAALRLELEHLDFEKGSLTFEDRRLDPPVRLSGEAMRLEAKNLAYPPAGAVPLHFSMKLPGNGTIDTQGTWHPAKGRFEARLDAAHLALQPYLPIVQQFLNIDIPTGTIDANATLRHDPARSPRTEIGFHAALSDLAIVNRHNGEKIFGLERVAVEEGRLTLSPNALLIPRISLVAPAFHIHIRKDRSSNLDHIFHPRDVNATASAPAAQKEAENGAAPRLDFAIAHIVAKEGRGDFADESLTIPFATSVHDMRGDLIGLNNREGSVAGAKFYGIIDRYGVMRARSLFISSDPTRDTTLAVAFRNLDITKVSPYIGKYLGYEIADGRLWVRVEYHIEHGRLVSKNSIVFKRLKLGKRLEGSEGIGAPVKLALDLLTDSQGNIDIDIPIEGNLTDPKVNLDGILLKALTRVVTKVVEAPFKILGKMLGVSGAALQYVHFDAGRSFIEATEKETLDALAEVLPRKPELKLVIPGVYEKRADTKELRKQKLRNLLIVRLQELSRRPIDEAMRSGALLESIYAERAGRKALEKFRKVWRGRRDEAPKKYLTVLFEKVLETFDVPQKELETLALERAKAVYGYLKASNVPEKQLAIGKIEKVDRLDDVGMVALKLDLKSVE
jgi:uncharacterized protein involved in outer membrane biogenesis